MPSTCFKFILIHLFSIALFGCYSNHSIYTIFIPLHGLQNAANDVCIVIVGNKSDAGMEERCITSACGKEVRFNYLLLVE